MTEPMRDAVERSVARLKAAQADLPPLAVLLGSGWNAIADRVSDAVAVPYAELPAFAVPGVGGHAGQVLIGTVGGRPVMMLCGRKHAYETGEADAMKGAIATLAAAGVQVLLQTNAAGSLDTRMRPGDLMLLSDHLNLVQRSPLFGVPDASRFVDMANAYDAGLRAQARRTAARLGQPLREGVYAWMMGPQFETPAEIRMLQTLGAQAVGMSTVPETILARHHGLRVLALSMMTNMGCGLEDEQLSHDHTLKTAQSAAQRAVPLLEAVIGDLDLTT